MKPLQDSSKRAEPAEKDPSHSEPARLRLVGPEVRPGARGLKQHSLSIIWSSIDSILFVPTLFVMMFSCASSSSAFVFLRAHSIAHSPFLGSMATLRMLVST